MQTKREALEQIIALINQHSISLTEIKANLANEQQVKNTSILRKFLGFLGGIFILCGLSIYIGQHWMEMNSAARIIITLGTGICLFILAMKATTDSRFEKVLTPLFLLAALFETFGSFVTIHELFSRGQFYRYTTAIVYGVMFIQQLIAFIKINKSSLLFIVIFFGFYFISSIFNLMHIKLDYISIILGVSLICLSYGLTNTKHEKITPFWYLIGGLLFLDGTFDLLQNTSIELAYLGISIFVIFISTLTASRTLLFCGTISLIGYIGYFTVKHFLNTIGWPVLLIMLGIMLIVLSSIAITIGRKIRK